MCVLSKCWTNLFTPFSKNINFFIRILLFYQIVFYGYYILEVNIRLTDTKIDKNKNSAYFRNKVTKFTNLNQCKLQGNERYEESEL